MKRLVPTTALVFVVMLMILPGVSLSEEPRSDEEMLREIKEVLWPRAYAEQDVDLLDTILADEFQMIDSEGNWSTKAQELAWVKANAPDYESLVFEIRRLDIFANGTAIVAGQGVIKGRFEKGGYTVRYQSSNVLIKRDGFWQAVSSHVSGVTPAVFAADIGTLTKWMIGSFSSAAQAAVDSAYYDIRLEMAPIWTDRDDAAWLYVEQAVAGMTDRPYRQRVYKVTATGDGVFESAVFTLPDPEKQVGAWRDSEPLKHLSPEDLEIREGCTVFLEHDDGGRFVGGTDDRACVSGLRGASYATSEVIVTPDRIESWDRGFDDEGLQVWGAEKGAYVFLRDAGKSE